MKTTIVSLTLMFAASLSAQTAGDMKLFRNKEAKVRSNNLHNLRIAENGNVELVAFLKSKSAEKIVLKPDLTLEKREEVDFDFDADEKRIGWSFWDYTYNKSEVVKTDILNVKLPSFFGIDLADRRKVGLVMNGAFKIQKGDIVLVQNEGQDYYSSWNGVSTQYKVKEEVEKFKSDGDKNLSYEFHSSNGEAIQESMNAILGKAMAQMYRKGNDHHEDGAAADALKNFKATVNADADMLLIGKRNPVYKFGKAPSEADMLPEYYAFSFSPKTMEEVTHSKFQEPVSRAVIYREALKLNKGILLVSAPTHMFNIKPVDENPRNYMFRLIGNDTKLKFELTHVVPSGFTQFSQALELPDSSIVLMAGYNAKKTDKYVNRYVTPFNARSVYIVTIKNGKVIHEETLTEDEWTSGLLLPQGEKIKKDPYTPAIELKENIANEYLPNGGLLSFWAVKSVDSKGLPIYVGDIALQFAANGKLEAKYWQECHEPLLKRATRSTVIRKGDHEFFWITFDPLYQKEEYRSIKSVSTKVIAGYANPSVVKINTTSKTISKKTVIGDEKHVVSDSFPYVQADNTIHFFGFDKGGKEFWKQSLVLD
jgi:hypothetical protein